MTGPRIRLAVLSQGTLSVLKDLNYDLEGVELGGGADARPVTSTFRLGGSATYDDAESFGTYLNQMVSDIRRIDQANVDDPYFARQQRWLLGFKKTTDTQREPGWWYSEILDGAKVPEPEYWDMGAWNRTKGWMAFRVAHRPYWWYETPTVIGSGNVTNASGSNYYALPAWFVTGPVGDAQAAFKLAFTNTYSGTTLTRISVGLLRGATSVTTLIGSWAGDITCPSPYMTNEVSVTLNASTVQVNQFPSGLARIVLMLDAIPPAGMQYWVSLDGQWRSVEPGHAMVRGPIVRVPSTRIAGLTAANTSLTMKVRYTGTAVSDLFPRGKLHLVPCDQWADYRSTVAYNHILTDDPISRVQYVKSGANSAIYDSVIRLGGPISPVNGNHCLVVFGERSTGAIDSVSMAVQATAWPRRRLI